MAEYTEAFAAFILQARDGFRDLEKAIDEGRVASGKAVTLKITVPPVIIDQIRFDRLAAAANESSDG